MSRNTKVALAAAIAAVVAFLGAYLIDLNGDLAGSDPTTTGTAAPTSTTEPAVTTTDPPATTTTRPTTTTAQPAGCASPLPHTPDGPDGTGGCWPGPLTTGVPEETTLTPYTGPHTITTPNTVIDKALIQSDAIIVKAPGVKITNTRMEGRLVVEGGSVTVEDSDIIADDNWKGPTVGYDNLTLRRVDVDKGWASVICELCTIEDTYLHGQLAPEGFATHNDAFYYGGGAGDITLRHNTLWCSAPSNDAGGGCSADAAIFGDFGPLRNITFDNNLFVASASSSYCGYFGWEPPKPYGSDPSGIVVTNNVFQRGPNGKCGLFGPVTSFVEGREGNVWENNTWAEGGIIPPG